MSNDLVERYIYAATKRMPQKQRDDVSMELRGLIEDMLTERCCGLTPSEKDIRVVLTELGTPQELYAKYDEDADKCLIGQPYYSTYKFVMGIVLGSVAIGATVANLLLQLIEPQHWFVALTDWLSMLWDCAFSAFTVVTLLFAFFQRKEIRLGSSFDFDELPSVPKRAQKISKWECIAGIFFCVVFAVLFIFTPEVFCAVYDGKTIALFDVNVIRATWFIILPFAACGIIREVVQLLEGRYNKKVMITAWVTNAISAVLSFWWLLGFEIMNPFFLYKMEDVFAGESGIVMQIFANFDVFFLGVMLFALVLDTIDVTVRTLRK